MIRHPFKSYQGFSHFHTWGCRSFPRNSLKHKNVMSKQRPTNRWGDFQRLAPATLVEVDVRQMERRPVPEHIMKPHYASQGGSSPWLPTVPCHTSSDISHLRSAGRLAKEILDMGGKMCMVRIRGPRSCFTFVCSSIKVARYDDRRNR